MSAGRIREHALAALTVAAAFVPLVFAKGLGYPFVTAKDIAVRVLAALLLPLLAWAWTARPTRPGVVGTAVLAALSAAALAVVFSTHPATSFWGNGERLNGFVTLAAFAVLGAAIHRLAARGGTPARVYAWSWFGVWGVVAAWAALERFVPGFWSAFNGGGSRSVSTIGNAIFLAEALLIATAGAATAALRLPARWRLAGVSVALGLGGFAILATETRGAFLGAAAGFAVAGIAAALWSGRRSWRIAGVVLAVCCVLTVPALYLVRDVPAVRQAPFLGRIASLFSANDPSIIQRLQLWRVAGEALRERPVFGWGLEQFDMALDRLYPTDFTRFGVSNSFSDRAHNAYLDVAAVAGLVGLCAYLALFAAVAWAVERARRSGVLSGGAAAAALGGIAAFGVSHLTSFDTHATLLAAAGTVPLLTAMKNAPERSAAPFPAAARIALTVGAAGLGAWTLLAGVIPLARGSALVHRAVTATTVADFAPVTAGIVSFENPYRALQEQRIANEIFKRVGASAQLADEDRLALAQAETLLRDAVRRRPASFSSRFTLANVLLLAAVHGGSYEAAAAAFEEARLLAPRRQMVDYQLGNLYLTRNMPEEALAVFRRALALDPSVPESHWHLGRGLAATGDEATAAREFATARRTGFTEIRPPEEISVALHALLSVGDYETVFALNYQLGENGDADAYAQAVAAAVAMGSRERALDAARRGIALDPTLRAEAVEFLRQNGYPEEDIRSL
ncbi:hypothetical protein EPO33_02770 [Patescibacteria group bacterium]|nr:MAG: hypothetical protein EPO33_02770 [Patescibacteria group bacterium]